MSTVIATDTATTVSRPPVRRRPQVSRWWGVTLFVSLTGLYFTVGVVLMLRYNLFDTDAASRVANAGFTFMSRDPHLSAIGFVWNPLPAVVEIPFVWLSQWWPPLKTHTLAGAAQSSLFMAGAVVMLRSIAMDRGMGAGWRRLIVAGFALHPVIIIFGQSGMSEAAEIFCLLWAIRYLLLWMETALITDLAWAAVALGVGYLARYELVVAACGAALLVGVVTVSRTQNGHRLTTAALVVLILLLPITVAFVVWALSGWVLADELFAQLSSRYGNAAQVSSWVERQGGVRPPTSPWPVVAGRLFAMQPMVLLATGIAIYLSLSRKRYELLVPLAVIGPIRIFAVYGQRAPTTFGFFRFYITAIPLVACIAVVCWRRAATPPKPDRAARLVGGFLVCTSVLVAIPVTSVAMLDRRIGDIQLQFGLNSLIFPERFTTADTWYRRINVNGRQAAKFFDDQHLPPGSVLMDTANSWGIWLASNNPKQFVITSDYDFIEALNRPWDKGIKYVVISSPNHYNADALNVRYPSLWETGAGIGRPALSVSGADGVEAYRIYEMIEPPKS